MSLTFYLGGAGSGKSHAVFEHIIEESLKAPDRRFLVLVPEQSTMETQRCLVKQHPRSGLLGIEVLSITRLAYRVFMELGLRKEEMLEEIGKTFLLEQAVLRERRKLSFYGDLLAKPEYLAEMKALISELMQYGVGEEALLAAAGPEEEAEGAGSPFSIKLRDIAHIFRAFRERLKGTYLTAEELPERLSEVIGDSAYVRGAVVALDGFTGFTPLQRKLLRRLLPAASEVLVTVTVDAASGQPSREALFGMSREMMQQLAAIAAEEGVRVESPVILPLGHPGRHAAAPALDRIERRLFREEAPPAPEREESGGSGPEEPGAQLRLFEAPSGREEIRYVSREIARLVREKGYRYRDFAVVTGDLGSYGNYVREIFPRSGLPFFIDEKRDLGRNPFMEFLRAALEAVTEDYAYSGIFRMLKTGVADFDRSLVDHLENYVIAMGIRGRKRWREPFLRAYRGEDPGELPALNRLRQEILALLDPMTEVFTARGSSVREKTTALYELCLRVGAEEMLRERAERMAAAGRRDLAREYAQVWPYIVSFLDKLVAVLGDERISMRDYRALVEAGFSEAHVAIIPPGNDQILIADEKRSRLEGVKVLFFVGVNEGLVPKAPSAGGLLTEADRRRLKERDIVLKPDRREQLGIDRFYLYLTLCRPSEALVLTWSLSGPSGEVLRPSFLISELCRLFPGLVPRRGERALQELIERESDGLSLLLDPLLKLDTQAVPAPYLELFSHYLSHPLYAGRAARLIEAAGARCRDERISRASARALYGEVLQNSASRLEKFFACRYAHFLAYGLRLKERQTYAFTVLDMGTVLHRALELFAAASGEEAGGWAGLAGDRERLFALADACVDAAGEECGGSILRENAREQYQMHRMRRLMRETVLAHAVQLEAGDFVPEELERALAGAGEAPLIELPLMDGLTMQLTGRIDRIDTLREGQTCYLKVIDYKSGSADFDLLRVYYGQQMQLPVYAGAAMELMRRRGLNPVLAGMFYASISDPVVRAEEGESPGETEERVLKELRPSGVVPGDLSVIRHMDRGLVPGETSKVIPVALKKDGGFAARSSVLETGALETVCRYVRRLAGKAAEEMFAGSAGIKPARYRGKSACDYCPYRGVCGFDPGIPGTAYEELPVLDEAELLRRMEEI